MDRKFSIGEKVYLRDYPWGKPLNIHGKVVGYLGQDYYNVLLSNGLNAGTIKPFKEWGLIKEECIYEQAEKKEEETDTLGKTLGFLIME